MPRRVHVHSANKKSVTVQVDAERIYYRDKLRALRDQAQTHFDAEGSYPKGYQADLNAIDTEMRLAGIDPKSVSIIETEAERLERAVIGMMDMPESVTEVMDDLLRVSEEQMDNADQFAEDEIERLTLKFNVKPLTDDDADRIRKEIEKQHGRIERGKAWRRRIQRLRRLRDRARKEVPRSEMSRVNALYGWEKIRYQAAIELAHPLRFMVYVGRSNITKRGKDTASLFQIAAHHARMATCIWKGKNWVYMTADGPQYGIVPFEGAIIICPPAHGKSEFINHCSLLWIDQDPREQMAIVHRSDTVASEMLRYAKSAFTTNTPVGRRNRALFPDLPEINAKDNSAISMRLNIGDTLRSATIVSNGVKNKRSGINVSKMLFDDITDPVDVNQKSERDNVKRLVDSTWMTRLRGRTCDRFWVWVNTIWHDEDAASKYLAMARKKKLNVSVLVMACGGPDKNFEPLWPEMYSRDAMRKAYQKDPHTYEAAYMSKPHSQEASIIRRLAYYAIEPRPDATEAEKMVFHVEHNRFFGGSVHHVSVDPSATNREKSDRAGMVYAAMGDMVRDETINGSIVTKHYARLRIIEARRERANQSEIVEYVAATALLKPVDYVHVETVGGFHATADLLESEYNIDVVRHQPGNKNKEIRLRRVASAIDNSRPTDAPAVVEFPGRWKETEKGWVLVPTEDVQWVVDELLRFGSAPTDDGVDAITQLVHHLIGAGDLPMGTGAASESVRSALKKSGDPRIAKFYAEIQNRNRAPKNADQADWDFHRENYE